MKTKLLSLFLLACSSASASAQNGWMKYRMYDGKFSFSLPCLPKIEKKDVNNQGLETKLKTYSCSTDDAFYVAAFTDIPSGSNAKAALDRARDDFAKGFRGRVTGEKMISVFAHQARDIWVRAVRKDREDVAVYRFVVVRDRLYALGVIKRADTPAAMQNEKFFSTFTLEG